MFLENILSVIPNHDTLVDIHTRRQMSPDGTVIITGNRLMKRQMSLMYLMSLL